MNKDPHYHGHRRRLREKLLSNPRQLADYEVMECLLAQVIPRQDTKPLAKELLFRFGSLRGAIQASGEELLLTPGVGPSCAAFFALLRETVARFGEAPAREGAALKDARTVADLARARLAGKKNEEFWVALVDSSNRVQAWECVSVGTEGRATVYPREVLALALGRKASGFFMVHNHPGGDARPSDDDVALTDRLARIAHDLDVRLVDHIIVTDNDYFSFRAQNML